MKNSFHSASAVHDFGLNSWRYLWHCFNFRCQIHAPPSPFCFKTFLFFQTCFPTLLPSDHQYMNICVQVISIKLLLSLQDFTFPLICANTFPLFAFIHHDLSNVQLRNTSTDNNKTITLGCSLFILAEYNCTHNFSYNKKLQDLFRLCLDSSWKE